MSRLSFGQVNLVHCPDFECLLFSFEMRTDTRPHTRGPANPLFLYQTPVCFLLSSSHSL